MKYEVFKSKYYATLFQVIYSENISFKIPVVSEDRFKEQGLLNINYIIR